MNKLIYTLWSKAGDDLSTLNARLKDNIAPALLEISGMDGLRLNLQDSTVTLAEPLRLSCAGATQPQAVVQIWADEVAALAVTDILRQASGRLACWKVKSSTIIANVDHPAEDGERNAGWSQICFLQKPDRLDHVTWLHNWQGLHTPVAVETQSNFEYIQNLIVETLIPGPQKYAAIVEECFPEAAMNDARVFFDAVDSEERFVANSSAMANSCARFIDAGGVDLLPTSQFDFRRYSAKSD